MSTKIERVIRQISNIAEEKHKRIALIEKIKAELIQLLQERISEEEGKVHNRNIFIAEYSRGAVSALNDSINIINGYSLSDGNKS